MRKEFSDSKIKFYLGDIRDTSSVREVVKNVDYIFHAAALKQVPSCEFYPMEAVKTNILGVNNLIDNAIDANVKKIICLSTDKAVYPINAMGASKSMMEKVITANQDNQKTLKFALQDMEMLCIQRFCNSVVCKTNFKKISDCY